MRFVLSVLPFLAAFACSTQPAAVPVQQAVPDAEARFVGPDDFQNPDCMWQFIGDVDAIVADFRSIYRTNRDMYREWYQDALAAGASPEELEEIRAEADRAKEALLDELNWVLAEFEQDVCGVDPCDDPADPDCCAYVGEDGQCYQDYCDAFPDDPQCQVWCDNPQDPDCFCEYEPDHPDCDPDCDLNGDGVCDECDENPDLCEPPCEDWNGDGVCDTYCDLNPQDPDCWQGCDNPNDPACFCEYEPDHPDCQPVDCDPATGDVCPDPGCEPGDPSCPDEPDCDPATGNCP